MFDVFFLGTELFARVAVLAFVGFPVIFMLANLLRFLFWSLVGLVFYSAERRDHMFTEKFK
jgi:hypothetical protein